MGSKKNRSILFSQSWFAIFGCFILIFSLLAASGNVFASTNTGYKDFSYSGVSAPTGQKPQSKLWYNDGTWWGSLYNKSSKKYEIHNLNWTTQTWTTTGTLIDERTKSSADVLWDGSRLYIASAVPPGTSGNNSIRVMRYSYHPSTKTYNLDSGFPVTVLNATVEAVVMDKDSTGKLWLTYTNSNASGGRSVFVTRTTTSDLTWLTPYVIPTAGAANLTSDDISTIVSFNNKIGVMWSNQNNDAVYFAIHEDGTADSLWQLNPALQGPKYADDHINIKSLQADSSGQVFAAVKTSLNDAYPNSSQPLILLLTLGQNGSWSRRTFGTVQDNHTRPIVLIDEQNRDIYIFATRQYGTQTSGAIYYKRASLDNASMQFPSGLGTPFIEFTTDTKINNASSTKQALNSTTDLVVIAGDDTSKFYFHNVIDLGASTSTPAPTATSVPTATSTPTPLPTATFTPTPLPTATTQPTSTPLPTDPAATNTSLPTITETPIETATPEPTSTVAITPTDPPPPLPTNTATPPPSQELFSDGFESGDFSAWSQVTVGGDGSATVQSSIVQAGSYTARLSATSSAGSNAYIRRSFISPETSIKLSGYFMITQEGNSNANVPIFRLYDPAGTRLVSLYRQNQSGNRLWIQINGVNNSTTGIFLLNTWGHFELHVTTAGAGASTVTVYHDGVQIFNSNSANLGTAGILYFQVGNDTAKQTFTLYADSIRATR